MRWTQYVATVGSPGPEVLSDVRLAAKLIDGRILYLLSVGFDPRCLTGLHAFLELNHETTPVLVRVGLRRLPDSADPFTRTHAIDNERRFWRLVGGHEVKEVDYPDVHTAVNCGPLLARSIVSPAMLEGVSTVVLDISSMPSMIYCSLLAALLKVVDKSDEDPERFRGNIFLVTCENPDLDSAIAVRGVEDAGYVGGFRPRWSLGSDPDGPVVWAPVIGEHCDGALNAVHSLLSPDEICPILPFPARDPRRSDSLLIEHRTILFDSFRVAESNIVFAAESNPFDLYRALSRLNDQYSRSLASLGCVTLAVSSHSSKLLSVGVLLAAYEYQLPLAASPVSDYELSDEVDLVMLGGGNRLSCIWLAGEPYR